MDGVGLLDTKLCTARGNRSQVTGNNCGMALASLVQPIIWVRDMASQSRG